MDKIYKMAIFCMLIFLNDKCIKNQTIISSILTFYFLSSLKIAFLSLNFKIKILTDLMSLAFLIYRSPKKNLNFGDTIL